MNKESREIYLEAQDNFYRPRYALKLGRQLLSMGKANSDYETTAYGHHIIGSALFVLGVDKGIMSHATQAVAFFRETDDVIMLIRALNLQGIAYTAAEEYQLALATYNEAYELAQQFEKSKYRRDIILMNLAAAHFSLGDSKKSLRVFERIYKRVYNYVKKDASFIFNVCYNMADICCEIGELEKALKYCKESEEFLKTCKEETLRGAEEIALAVVATKIHYKMENLELAHEWSDKLEALIKTGHDSFELHRDYEKIVMMQLDLGENDRADFYADFLWDSAQKSKNTLDMMRAVRMQARYFDLQDNTRMALYYYRMMDKINEKRSRELIESQFQIAKNNEMLVKKMKAFQKAAKEKEELEILASKDSLTGLLNRGSLQKFLERYTGLSKEEGKPVGCIFVDVDYFKEFNDTYGHVQGDECLKVIADACRAVKGDNMNFIRYGGDEFFGIGYGISKEELCQKAKDIMKKVRECNMKHDASKICDRVSVSIGVLNIVLEDDSNILDIVNFSDRALYHSKECGRNCIHMFDEVFFKNKHDMDFILID